MINNYDETESRSRMSMQIFALKLSKKNIKESQGNPEEKVCHKIQIKQKIFQELKKENP